MKSPYHKSLQTPQAPEWFDNAKYEGLYNLSNLDIYKMLKVRSELWFFLKEEKPLNEAVFSLVDKKFSHIKSDPFFKHETYLIEDHLKFIREEVCNIKSKPKPLETKVIEHPDLNEIDLIAASKGVSYREPVEGLGVDDEGSAFFSMEYFFETGVWDSEARAHVEGSVELFAREYSNTVIVNLDAPEGEIRDSFNRWLKKAQKENGSIKKPSFETDKNSIINHRVLQYIDLDIFNMLENKKTTRAEMAEIIFGHDVKGLSKLDDSTRPKAEQVLHGRYLEWLKNIVIKSSSHEKKEGSKLKRILSAMDIIPKKFL
jgi:hypothetical protein